MQFQNSVIQLFEECGKPKIGGRSRRSPVGPMASSRFSDHSSRIPIDDIRYSRNGHNQSPASFQSQSSSTITGSSSSSSTGGSGHHNHDGPGPSLERLITDIKRRVKKTKDFWVRGLSSNVCTKLSTDNDLSSSTMDSSALNPDSSSLLLSSSSHPHSSGEEQHQQTTNCWNGSAIIL